MKASALISAGLLFAVLGSGDAASTGKKPFPISGISFPLIGSNYLDDIPGWTPIPTVIEELTALGANDVKVSVSSGFYDTPLDNFPDPSVEINPSDEKIVAFFRQLKAAGFQITVVPFVNIAFDPNGNLLDTVHPQPTDFDVWMAAHTDAMVHLAQLAEAGGADHFAVFGDEVGLLTYVPANQAGWLEMIARIRGVFSGAITSSLYADGTVFNGGNDHIDLTQRPLIDALDILGISFFPMPLTHTADPPLCRLLASWRSNVKGLDSVAFLRGIHEKYDKPILIADIAFHSFAGDNMNSNDIYDATIPLTADQQEQADEYDSFLTVMAENAGAWLVGVDFDSWNRFPADYPVARFLNSPYGENIRGKLAQTVLTDWYTGRRAGATSRCVLLPGGDSSTPLPTVGHR